MKYSIEGNLARIDFYPEIPVTTNPEPKHVNLHVVDGDLLNHLYERAQYVARMGKGYMKQRIYNTMNMAQGRVSVNQFVKAQLKKIDKMIEKKADYTEILDALKYTVAIANIFGVACQMNRDENGVMLRSFVQVTDEMIQEEVKMEEFKMGRN